MIKNYNLRLIKTSEVPILALFLAEIFFDNPGYASIFPGLNTREENLAWLLEKNLLLQKCELHTWVTVPLAVDTIRNKDEIIGTITLLSSFFRKNSVKDYFKTGLLTIPFKFGFGALYNLLKINKFNEDQIKQASDNNPFWYLCMVAVAKKYRGNGIATTMINGLISSETEIYQSHLAPMDIILTTQLASNVSLYQKLGFKLINNDQISSPAPYLSWTMKRKPANLLQPIS